MDQAQGNWQAWGPEAKHEAVSRALQSAFGTTSVEEPGLLTGGSSNSMVLKITVDNRDMNTPRLREFHMQSGAQLAEGKSPLSFAEGLLLYGKVRLNEALIYMKTSRFTESLRWMTVSID